MSTPEPYVPPLGLAKTREEFIKKIRQPLEDPGKPRTHHQCGNCLAFKTHFCPFWLRGDGEPATQTTDHACTDWLPRTRIAPCPRFNWATVVTNL